LTLSFDSPTGLFLGTCGLVTKQLAHQLTQPLVTRIAVKSTMPTLMNGTVVEFDGQVAHCQVEGLDDALRKSLGHRRN
jgi:hypothetical protein